MSSPCGFFSISALGGVREKVRAEVSGISISLCLSSPAGEIRQILWPCLGFFAPKHPQPPRKIQLVVSKLSPDTKSSHTNQKSKLGMLSITSLFYHLAKCTTPLLRCEMMLWQLRTAAEPEALWKPREYPVSGGIYPGLNSTAAIPAACACPAVLDM